MISLAVSSCSLLTFGLAAPSCFPVHWKARARLICCSAVQSVLLLSWACDLGVVYFSRICLLVSFSFDSMYIAGKP